MIVQPVGYRLQRRPQHRPSGGHRPRLGAPRRLVAVGEAWHRAGGLRLHLDTIRALKANNPALGPALRPPWAAIALIALVVLAALPW